MNTPVGARKLSVTYYYRGKLVRKPGRGVGGGYLFPAAAEETASALREAGRVIDQAAVGEGQQLAGVELRARAEIGVLHGAPPKRSR